MAVTYTPPVPEEVIEGGLYLIVLDEAVVPGAGCADAEAIVGFGGWSSCAYISRLTAARWSLTASVVNEQFVYGHLPTYWHRRTEIQIWKEFNMRTNVHFPRGIRSTC